MRAYQSGSQQTIFDVALVCYGSLEGLAWLLADNPEVLQSDGTLAQFGATYRTRKEVVDARVVSRLLRLPVATGATSDSSGAWLNAQVVPWVTAQDTVWQMPTVGASGSAGARPDYFQEEANPTDANFEVYSQHSGVNRKAKLSKVGPRIAAVSFVPAVSGNTQSLNTVVTDPNGDVWFISGTGGAVKLNSGGTAQVVNWHVAEQWVTGSTVTWAFTLPNSASDLKEKVMLFRNGTKMRYFSDWTRTVSGGIALAIDAQNEVFEIYIHQSLI
jgi:hypothetical protein